MEELEFCEIRFSLLLTDKQKAHLLQQYREPLFYFLTDPKNDYYEDNLRPIRNIICEILTFDGIDYIVEAMIK